MSWHGIKLPPTTEHNVRVSEQNGHELVSQGCSLFRCVRCDRTQFLDSSASPMPKPCTPKAVK